MHQSDGLSLRKKITIGVLSLAVIVLLGLSAQIVETLNADELMVIQRPMGTLDWYVAPGIKLQGFGHPTHYPKRSIYEFSQDIRFNDGGHGTINGSIQYEMPLDFEHLNEIHTKFGSPQAVQSQLVETIVNKSIYMSGPLMSSRESYAAKRNDLIFYIQDQIEFGVYKTSQTEVTGIDELSGEERTVTIVTIKANEDGTFQRQEEAFLTPFGIRPFALAIDSMPYEDAVEDQITRQQGLAMEVQESIVAAKTAQQRTITVEEQGRANAAEAKWKQEVIKATQVTQAQQKLEVASLAAKEAEQYKIQQLLKAEGDAGYKRQVMEADGALQPKLDAWLKSQEYYANAIKEYKGNWVPGLVMGGGTTGTGVGPSSAQQMLDLLGVKAAKDLQLDFEMRGSK